MICATQGLAGCLKWLGISQGFRVSPVIVTGTRCGAILICTGGDRYKSWKWLDQIMLAPVTLGARVKWFDG